MGWIISADDAAISSDKFRKHPPKISEDKISKGKIKEEEGTSAKQKFLDFVFLSDDEHKKLLLRDGDKNINKLIDSLNRYIGSSGKKYKSHYYTLLNFAKRDNIPEINKPKEDNASEQQSFEKQKQKIRDEDSEFYREKTIKELEDMLQSKESVHITRRWLIKEILEEKLKKEIGYKAVK